MNNPTSAKTNEYNQSAQKWTNMQTLQELLNDSDFKFELKHSEIFIESDYDKFTEMVSEEVSCDPEFQGEEGLLRAYEQYAEDWQVQEVYIDSELEKTVWVWIK